LKYANNEKEHLDSIFAFSKRFLRVDNFRVQSSGLMLVYGMRCIKIKRQSMENKDLWL